VEITIRPKNFKLQLGIKSQVQKRVERVTRHLDNLDSCEVILTQEPTHYNAQRVQYVVQLTLRTRNNNLIRSEVSDADLLTGIDQAIDHLARQIERFKGRFYQKNKGKQGVGKSSAEIVAMRGAEAGPSDLVEPTASSQSALYDGATNEDELGEVVRVKRFSVQAMWPEEAIEQMELLGHSFYVFYNAGEEQLNVLYRRTDGNYGLLQPEFS
jgi:putative sigma-54 modulation protein